jgi:hypothetical protein
LLAIGLLAREKPLLAGLAAGVALIYDPGLAAPLGVCLILAFILDRRLRRLLRPALTVVAVFILLLANLAQLQPGVAEEQSLFATIPAPYAAMQQFRTPYHYVSLWSAGEVFSYLVVWICGVWAVFRVRPFLNRQSRWLLLSLPACGAISMLLSYILLDCLKWSFVPSVQPTRWLMFTVCLSSVACWVAGSYAVRQKKTWQGAAWLLTPLALPFCAEVLDLLRINHIDSLERLSFAAVLSAVSALLLVQVRSRDMRGAILCIPLILIFLLRMPFLTRRDDSSQQAVDALADWVKSNTWGSSMFLFPDIGRSNDPGLFRARSERALWVDWNGGTLIPLSQSFASVWWDRWHKTMQPPYSAQRLQAELSLPIDYYVLSPANRVPGIKPVFSNDEFLVYDANDLRNLPEILRGSEAR